MASRGPHNSLLKNILRTVLQREMLRAGDCLGLAVSGGADSTALLRIFAELRKELGLALCVLHLHHRLRGADADADETFVRQLAAAHSLRCIVEKADVSAIARENRWNLEDAGRRLRYAFFDKLLASKRVTRVATAHTADDQAETVLARILRGSGIAGLCAIEPVRGGIIRPLLGIRRAELRSYLRALGQGWREDGSNRDTRRFRARIRERLLPLLEAEFSPSVVEKLAALAGLAQQDEVLWSALAEERCKNLSSGSAGATNCAQVAAADLLAPLGAAFPVESQRALSNRIVRLLHAKLGKNGQLSREHVARVMNLAAGANRKRLELPGMTVLRKAGRLYLEKSGKGQEASGKRGSLKATTAGSESRRAPRKNIQDVQVAHSRTAQISATRARNRSSRRIRLT